MDTREQAKQDNNKTYTAPPCSKCGGIVRRTDNTNCVDCNRARQRAYYVKNKERLRGYAIQYRTEHPDRIKNQQSPEKTRRRRQRHTLNHTVIYTLTTIDDPTIPIYVGKTKQPKYRLIEHRRKYGPINMNVVATCDDSISTQMETTMIEHFTKEGFVLDNKVQLPLVNQTK